MSYQILMAYCHDGQNDGPNAITEPRRMPGAATRPARATDANTWWEDMSPALLLSRARAANWKQLVTRPMPKPPTFDALVRELNRKRFGRRA